MNGVFEKVLPAVFTVLLIFVLLITSFEKVCYWTPGIYEKEFKKYNVIWLLEYWRGETMDMDGLNTVMDETMSFLRGNREDLHVMVPIDGKVQEFYNETEISHMTDVRGVFLAGLRLRILAAIGCLAILFWAIKKHGSKAPALLGRGYLRTCLVILIIVIVLGILAATNFSRFFVIFHEIFFSQGNWMFDPAESRMIDIMPEEFFSDIARDWLLTWLFSVAVLLIPAWWLGRKCGKL